VDDPCADSDIPDPLSSMFSLLAEKRNRQLTQQWGIWLTKKDPGRTLKVFFFIITSALTIS